jgi:hypothetical protein
MHDICMIYLIIKAYSCARKAMNPSAKFVFDFSANFLILLCLQNTFQNWVCSNNYYLIKIRRVFNILGDEIRIISTDIYRHLIPQRRKRILLINHNIIFRRVKRSATIPTRFNVFVLSRADEDKHFIWTQLWFKVKKFSLIFRLSFFFIPFDNRKQFNTLEE